MDNVRLERDLAVHLTVVCVAMLMVALVAMPGVGLARRHHGHHNAAKPEPSKPGNFDYYVLSLSWSPEHCAETLSGPDDSQCGTTRHYAFVVHGLWPQYENGAYPENCSMEDSLTDGDVQKALDVMPSEALIRHEWQKHGTCSGLSPAAYFADARQAFNAIAIPGRYKTPTDAFRITAADARREFRTANPSLPEDGIFVLCEGHFLTEVRLCLAKDDLTPRACGRKVSDNCTGQVTVRPVR